MFEILIYSGQNRNEPFTEWFITLDPKTRNRVFNRILRIQTGNLGDHKYIREGVYELRMFFDGGLRIYFGRDGKKIVVLLCRGNKNSQRQDIQTAIKYWSAYQNAKK